MDGHERTNSFMERMRKRIRRFVLGAAWLVVIIGFGSISLSQHTEKMYGLDDPIRALQRIATEEAIVVDKLSVTFLTEAQYAIPFRLAALKQILEAVRDGIEELDSAERYWQMNAFADVGLRGMRFHGENEDGTAWNLTAYQLSASNTTYVALRMEYANLPRSLAEFIHNVSSLLQTSIPASHALPQLHVVFHARTLTTASVDEQGMNLLHHLGAREVVRVHGEDGNVFMAGVLSEAMMTPNEERGVELMLTEDENNVTRVRIGMPHLGMVEML